MLALNMIKSVIWLVIFLLCRSVSLLIQVILPCALFSPSPVQLLLRGGTNADMAPQIDYTVTVSLSIIILHYYYYFFSIFPVIVIYCIIHFRYLRLY